MAEAYLFLGGTAFGAFLLAFVLFVVDRIIGKEIADEGQLQNDVEASREADRGA